MAKASFTKDGNTDEEIHWIVPEWGNGQSKEINGQTAVFIPSPFPQYTGGVWIPYELSPVQFDAWRRSVMARAERDADKGDPSIFDYWADRYTFVLEWDMTGIAPDMVTPDGMRMPSTRVISWIARIGSELIIRATSFPN